MKELEEIYNKINNLNYLLDRKIEILNIILNITKSQHIVFKEDRNVDSFIEIVISAPGIATLDLEQFSISLEEKQGLIDELINIDEMFLSIFEGFKGALNQNKNIFKEDLKKIQNKIQQISDIDLKIRLQEEKNKQLINNNVNFNQEKIKTLKVSKNEMLKKYMNNTKK